MKKSPFAYGDKFDFTTYCLIFATLLIATAIFNIYCYPPSMNSPTIPMLVRGAHLALGIPALAPATGAQRFGSAALNDIMIDVNANTPIGVERVNGWPSLGSYTDRWCHSDMKDVSFFFNFKFYQKVVEKGELR